MATHDVKSKVVATTQTADARVIEQSLRRLLAPGHEVIELRALKVSTPQYRRPHTVLGYFDREHVGNLARTAAQLSGHAAGVYVTLNGVNPALLARRCNRVEVAETDEATKDGDILRRYWLLIDCDPQRPAGISATEEEKAMALAMAERVRDCLHEEFGWPDPMTADSGNGFHLLYRIDLPGDDGGLVKRALAALADTFDTGEVKIDRAVFNAARICKLPGTLTRKGENLPQRPHRLSRIIAPADEEIAVVTREQLEELAGPPDTRPGAYQATSDICRHRLDVAKYLQHFGRDFTLKQGTDQHKRKVYVLKECPFDSSHRAPDSCIMQATDGTLSAHCFHNSCNGRGWREFRFAIGNPLPDHYDPPHRHTNNGKHIGTTPSASSSGTPSALNCAPIQVPASYQFFPLASLPEPVCAYVDACSAAIGGDPSYVALPMLSTLAGAIGNSRRVMLKSGWSEPAIVWTAIVGESGMAKSPALDCARHFPRRRQSQAKKRHAAAMEQHDAAQDRYKAALKVWNEGDQAGDRPERPKAPVLERALVDDTTVEALGPILVDNWRGVLLLPDELAGWLGAFNRYSKTPRGGGEAAKWIEMHGGRPIIIDRRHGDPRTLFVPRAAVSIGGAIQLGILRRIITQEYRDNGLLARLLMTWPPRRPRRWSEVEPHESLTASIQMVYDRLWGLGPTTDSDGDPAPVLVSLTPDAKQIFIDFVNANGAEQFEMEGDLAAAWSKLEGYAARLALLHHLVRWAAGERLDPEHGIDAESMLAGITLARWFGSEDRRIYAALDESRQDCERRQLLELIGRRDGQISARGLQQASRNYRTAADADAALEDLVKAGLGTWDACDPTPRGGRASRVFRLR